MTTPTEASAYGGASRPQHRSKFTVAGWQSLVLSVMGAVVLVGAVAGGILMNRTVEAARIIIDHIEPARAAALQVQAALRDQETAVRGYVIAADQQFLGPYYAGKNAEQAAAQSIREHIGDRSELVADLDAIEQAAADWRTNYAEPLIASVSPGVPNTISSETAARGKAQFDHLRQLFDIQDAHLAAARASAEGQLVGDRAWRDWVLAAMVSVFFITAALLAVLTRNAVTRPLAALAAACRRITKGDFDETIPAQGPRDVHGIAVDVENMRKRIVNELEVSQLAQARLAKQAEALDEQTVELRRSNAELEQFAYVASHDLQEPLRKVASFCQLLETRYGDKLDKRGLEYIGFAVDGAKRMQVLINDLLTFSRVGRLNKASTDVNLSTALDGALTNLAAILEESAAEIVRPSRPLPTVIGDPTLLTMLWQNLISNAVKFRNEGLAPRIVIDCQRGSGDRDGQWLFSVSDNGIGIAEEFAEKVFAIFQRLHGRDAYAGTGIGLALCKKIVEYHGGGIWIDPSYTEGTRLRFTIPVSHEAPVTPPLQGAHP
jgi:signal transduction histidine kinase